MNDYFNSIPFDTNLWSENPEVNECVSTVQHELRLAKFPYAKWRKSQTDHLKLILQNLLRTYRQNRNRYVAYSRRKNEYYPSQVGTNGVKVSFDTTMRIVNGLQELGFIEGVKGKHYRHEGGNKYLSRMRPTQRLIELFTPIPALLIEEDVLLLREPKAEGGKPIPFPDTDDTIRMRANLHKINKLLDDQFFGLCVKDDKYQEIEESLAKQRKYLNLERKTLKRIFNNGSFDYHGRFYGGWWLDMPKELRKHIRINNYITHEVDFCGYHVNLLYVKNGLAPMQDDVYSVVGLPAEARPFLKKSLNCLLNTESRATAIKAIRFQSNTEKDFPNLPQGMTIEEIVAAFEVKHHAICHLFYKCSGLRMMRTDSDIAESILLELLDQGILALPVHDSFIVSRLHLEELLTAMQNAVIKMFGTPIYSKREVTVWQIKKELGLDEQFQRDVARYEQDILNDQRYSRYLTHKEQWESSRDAGAVAWASPGGN